MKCQTPICQQTECLITNRLNYRESSHYDVWVFSPLDITADCLSHLALVIYTQECTHACIRTYVYACMNTCTQAYTQIFSLQNQLTTKQLFMYRVPISDWQRDVGIYKMTPTWYWVEPARRHADFDCVTNHQQLFVKYALQWRHNERNGCSNHQPHHRLPNRLFRRRPKKTSELRVTGLLEGFPAQRASNAENVSIW